MSELFRKTPLNSREITNPTSNNFENHNLRWNFYFTAGTHGDEEAPINVALSSSKNYDIKIMNIPATIMEVIQMSKMI